MRNLVLCVILFTCACGTLSEQTLPKIGDALDAAKIGYVRTNAALDVLCANPTELPHDLQAACADAQEGSLVLKQGLNLAITTYTVANEAAKEAQ